MRIEKDQKRMALILAGMALVFTAGFWLPQHLREEKLNKIITGVAESAGLETVDLRRLPPLIKEVNALTKELEAQTRFVPEDAQLAPLLKSISGELSARAVRDAETQTLPVVAGARYCVLPVSLRFQGSFPAAYHFLSTIESSRRLVWVTRLEMTRPAEASAQDVSVVVELCSFYSPTEESRP
ncbi:MAG: type 4a pilus biogenesis protein PilO [Planctomycetota bacterium]|nr:type 4a pilus biogenesis protein PilO [Planctomycetota bacterium]